MDERVQWMFDLQDRLSGAAEKMSKATELLDKAMQKASKDSERAEKEFRKQRSVLEELTSAAHRVKERLVDLGFDLVREGTTAVMNLGYEMGKSALEAISFRENTEASFKAILGSQKEAEALFKSSALFGKYTPFETKDVVTGFQQLLSAGFSKQEVPIVFQAIGDVSALSGFDQTVLERLTYNFAQIKSLGKLQYHDLRDILMAGARAGLDADTIYKYLGADMHKTKAEVMSLVSMGGVDANTGIFAILQALREKSSGGNFGKTMLDQAGTITGLMSTLKSSFTDFFLTADSRIQDMPGVMAFKGTLQNLADLFDTNNTSGQMLQDTLVGAFNNIFSAVFGVTSGPGGMKTMQSKLEEIVGFTKGIDWKGSFASAKEVFKDVTDTLSVLWTVAKGVGTAFSAVGKGIGFLASKGVDIANTFQSANEGLIQGMNEGNVVTAPFLGGYHAGRRFLAGMENVLEINSPSRAMARIGRYSAQGFHQGVGELDGASVAQGAVRAASGAGAVGPGGGRALHVGQIPVHIHLPAGAGIENPSTFAHHLKEQLPSALLQAFELIVAEMGAGDA